MNLDRILVTGGAGFVGSHLAQRLKQEHPDREVLVLDNLLRRGSELNLPKLREAGVVFVHGDIRCREDLANLPPFDLLIECSAEPSVHAGQSGSPLGLINLNLGGTVHCLEAARERGAALLFLSTSRVYPIAALNAARVHEGETRFVLEEEQDLPGLSAEGTSEAFPLEGARSFYGSTKLAGELLLQEYVFSFGMPALINRCGVLAGPGQMGKVDQGVVTLWVARHIFGIPLQYTGWGGKGKQVRDMLHVEDLFQLLQKQLARPELWDGRVYNVGGGLEVSASLLELTGLCRQATGKEIPIGSSPKTNPVDVRIYLSDARRVREEFDWSPQHSVRDIVTAIRDWIEENREELRPIFCS
ncbi:MAG TPA: NAD-dependent epimerase/dehydratase family protein [Planctomycetes bacterium]|nr:NAD-dependent epimerase/dehydratase family protein [Planctomycetota bacterium]